MFKSPNHHPSMNNTNVNESTIDTIEFRGGSDSSLKDKSVVSESKSRIMLEHNHLKTITKLNSTDQKIRDFRESLEGFNLKSRERSRNKDMRNLSCDKFERMGVRSPQYLDKDENENDYIKSKLRSESVCGKSKSTNYQSNARINYGLNK